MFIRRDTGAERPGRFEGLVWIVGQQRALPGQAAVIADVEGDDVLPVGVQPIGDIIFVEAAAVVATEAGHLLAVDVQRAGVAVAGEVEQGAMARRHLKLPQQPDIGAAEGETA